MADISDVQASDIKEISDSLEMLSCKCSNHLLARQSNIASSNFDPRTLLICFVPF
jgi:hypothetical protein